MTLVLRHGQSVVSIPGRMSKHRIGASGRVQVGREVAATRSMNVRLSATVWRWTALGTTRRLIRFQPARSPRLIACRMRGGWFVSEASKISSDSERGWQIDSEALTLEFDATPSARKLEPRERSSGHPATERARRPNVRNYIISDILD